jgi:hypothetical protein
MPLNTDLNWFPVWAFWIVVLWLGMHLAYDISLSRYIDAQRKPGEPPPGKAFGFLRYSEIMKENTRRFEMGDPLARIVTYADIAMAGAFVVFVVFRIFWRGQG